MKFLCSNCKAKYQIPDEKIAGRTLKMDCRRCNTPITIRGDQPQPDELDAEPSDDEPKRAATASSRARAPATSAARPAGAAPGGSSAGAHPAAGAARPAGRSAIGADFRRNVGTGLAAPEAPRVTPLDQWHVAINDVPVGPMKRDEIARKIQAGAANGDSLAWREGFDDWRPIKEIPELAALLRRAAESERPGARPGMPRAPAPRAPAPRPGIAPTGSTRSPLAAGARPAAARNNVVPIGGRLGASAAPSYDPDEGEGESEGEATTVASAAELGLGDFGKPVRDDGEIPSPHQARPKAGATGGLKPIPAPASKGIPAKAPLAAPARPAPRPPRGTDEELAAVAALAAPAPAREPEPKRQSFAPPAPDPFAAPPPSAAAPSVLAPIAARPVSVPPARDDRRGGLGVGAMMGIGFAMAAGGVLMYALVQRFVLSPPPPTTTVVATIATVAPTSDLTHEATLDVTPPPSTTDVPATTVAPTTTVAAPTTTVAAPTTTTSPRHTGTAPSTGTPPRTTTTRPPTGDDPFAQFADDGAGPAPIATSTSAHHEDGTGPAHSSAELTGEQIGAVVRSGQRALTTCWETALRQAGHVDGDVRYNMDITIGTTGRVTSVTARGPTIGSLQECLERGVRRWVFPPSSSATQTTFPLLFAAQQ